MTLTEVNALIDAALAEDVGAGDWTTQWTVPPDRAATARLVAKASGVLAGVGVAREVFRRVDAELHITAHAEDGDAVEAGSLVLIVEGAARSILTAERVALNFVQRLSGVATVTRAYVDAVAGTGARILDTRKTTPGMRALEKQAVLAGGGENHRLGLHDMILIKENHIRAAGGITAALHAVGRENSRGLRVEVEATTLPEVREAIAGGVHRVLLDNMELLQLSDCVSVVRAEAPGVEIEASGGISLETVRDVAGTGVDFISVGALTHSAPALDLSLLFDS